ncbi:tail fiber domain-containing protein [Schlegelella aquatica]|uniref:tail fiber domain-containing protein n=1 Tax=Caldimonas aquatica TaxID=376175 RepID=UPI003751FFB1
MSAEILVTVGADGTLELTTSAALQTIEVASPGPEGPGAPRGGATNQVVAKASDADLDFKFVTLTPQFVGAEPAVTSGTTSDYWRGDKTWRNFFADVRAATLTGLSTAVNAVVTAADTVLSAIGKLQAQVTGLASSKLDAAAPSFDGNAATSTKLQTARAINGVPFDGSADITTANWGTARTLTIGNTGKSVDGSANVSWSLAEIGAPATDGTGATGTWGVSITGNAATATTLQTARTINGTSFDGSADITTANWGTARTLTIGNTGKSVDGSANVSWSLAEIGAPATDGTGATGTWGVSITGNAATATTLQTARTINGTSFDGSANITTANWGAARTLTIGNTGKSVDGSANVSWSLAEMGALPAAGGVLTGNLRLRGTSDVALGSTSAALQIHGDNANDSSVAAVRASGDAFAGKLYVAKARGTLSAPALVSAGDQLGEIGFFGYDGATYARGAMIEAAVDAAPGAGDMPTRLSFYTAPDGSATALERVRITANGDVGIGTSSPGSPFHVAKTNSAAPVGNGVHMGYESPNGNAWIQLNSASGGISYIDFSTDGTDYKGRVAYNLNSNILEFHANSTPRAYLTSGGDFWVGSLDSNFGHVAIVGGVTNGGVGFIQVGHSSGVANGHWYHAFRYGNNVIGTIAQASTSSVAYNTTSDRRLKTNIAPAPDAGPVIDGIDVVSHDWKIGGHTRFGVIAQDLHDIYPEAVTPGDDADGGQVERPWSVDYSKLVPLLVKEVQSLRARVAALEAKEEA